MTARGCLVVLEGVDGCGKSTQARRLAAARGALATFEPGDTALGRSLRDVVLDAGVAVTPLAEVLVMSADRAQHVAEVLRPALESGRDVVCDRFSASTLAYQGYGRGLDLGLVAQVVSAATGGLDADATILLDCPVDVARRRRSGRDADRFEAAERTFLERVRAGYLELAAGSATWRVVDATAPLEEVSRAVDAALAELLG